jgi:hypothetical protein
MRWMLVAFVFASATAGAQAPAAEPPAVAPKAGGAESPPGIDGVYRTCSEVAGYSGTILELKGGRYRYQFWTDVDPAVNNVKTPLEGPYEIKAGRVILDNKEILQMQREWTPDVVQGIRVLWRDDGLQRWRKEKRVHPYAVLLHTADVPPIPNAFGPSIRVLYDRQMIEREEKEYVERFSDQPEPVRTLMRAKTLRGDSDMNAYKAELRRHRSDLKPELVRQLMKLRGHDGLGVTAQMTLKDLYDRTFLLQEDPPCWKSGKEYQAQLSMLIDSLDAAQDRQSLESALILFLRVSSVGKMELDILETGVRVSLEAVDGTESHASSTIPGAGREPKTHTWKDELPLIVPACQAWCREKLASARPPLPHTDR